MLVSNTMPMEMNYYFRRKVIWGWILTLSLNLLTLSAQTFSAKTPYQGQWAFAPGLAHRPTNSIYLLGTYQFADLDQLLRYNVGTNSWSTVAGVPAIKSEFGFAFVVNDRIFFGGGVDQPGTFTNLTYEFIPPSTFTAVDNIPNGPASSFSLTIGNYAYVGGGMVAGFGNLNAMYRFDQAAASGSQWTTVSTYPGSGKINNGKASLNGYGYVGLGRSNPGTTEYNDFWRFDPNSGAGGTWTAMSPFPGIGRECPIITPVCGKLVLMGGCTQAGFYFNDMWQFDPAAGATGTWTYLGTSNGVYGPQNGRYGPAYASYGDSLFLGMGFGATGANADWKMFTYCPVTPLPVELINFEANANENNYVNILWSTASEINNSHFEIYRSTDANNWEMIERVEGNGNSSILLNYQVTDHFPEQGINYYQLKQVDYNGDIAYSEITSVNVEEAGYTFIVYPNPVNNELNIRSQAYVEPFTYSILNSYGAEMLSGTLKEKLTIVPFNHLSPGIYYLQINDSKRTIVKIMKL